MSYLRWAFSSITELANRFRFTAHAEFVQATSRWCASFIAIEPDMSHRKPRTSPWPVAVLVSAMRRGHPWDEANDGSSLRNAVPFSATCSPAVDPNHSFHIGCRAAITRKTA
jgi:hypothetical protein